MKRNSCGRIARKSRALVSLLWIGAMCALPAAARADAVLETSRACDGTLLNTTQRLEIVGWDGDSRETNGQRVYDYRVRCDGGERDGIDLFIAAERSDRYKREGNTLMRLERTERNSVKIKEAGCEQIPKQVQRPPPDDEIRETCRNRTHPVEAVLRAG